jgi:hypothetical protein
MGEFSDLAADVPGRPERQGIADRLRSLIEGGRTAIVGVGESGPLRPGAGEDEEPPLAEEV